MKIVIVGCGRVGAVLAEQFDAAGHDVVVIDLSSLAFDRLSGEFRGQAIRGDGTDEDTLRRAGAKGADVFLALTEGDNRNVMAAQVAAESLEIEKVIAKINDPVRAAAYAELGIATVCRTTMLSDAISAFLGFEQSGIPSIIAAVGHHHDRPGGAATDAAGRDPGRFAAPAAQPTGQGRA
ncbi:MAG TPA: TrkA family potassium uptake protein [Candidatus Limnocylindrales bacterium]|nr:TrkA family potassium uptake protein [Candidatus Limnocylindrales bacterium]